MSAKIIYDMPAADYHAAKALSASKIKQGRVSMRHMRQAVVGPPKEQTAAMRWGTLLHAALLEPAVFSAKASIYEGKRDDRVKAWQEHCAEHDKEFALKQDEMGKLLSSVSRIVADPNAARLLEDAQKEVSIFWEDNLYGPAKARIDVVGPAGLVLLKTTRGFAPGKTASDKLRPFWSTAGRLGYLLQGGWYRHGHSIAAKCQEATVHAIIQESSEPYDVVVARIPESMLAEGYEEAALIAKEYRVCESLGHFSGVTDEVIEWERPGWAGVGAAEWEPGEE